MGSRTCDTFRKTATDAKVTEVRTEDAVSRALPLKKHDMKEKKSHANNTGLRGDTASTRHMHVHVFYCVRGERWAAREHWTRMMSANHYRHCSGRTIMENTGHQWKTRHGQIKSRRRPSPWDQSLILPQVWQLGEGYSHCQMALRNQRLKCVNVGGRRQWLRRQSPLYQCVVKCLWSAQLAPSLRQYRCLTLELGWSGQHPWTEARTH